MIDDRVHLRQADKKIHQGLWFAGGDEEVEVVQGFLAATVTAGNFSAQAVGVGLEFVENEFGLSGDIAEAKAIGILLAEGDGFENFVLGLFAKTGQLGNAVFLAGSIKAVNRGDAEFFVEILDAFGTESLDFKKIKNGSGEFGFEIVVKLEFSGGGQLVQFVGQGFADAFGFDQIFVASGGGDLQQVALEVFDHFGAGFVSTDFEGVFVLKIEQEGDFFKNVSDLFAGKHGDKQMQFDGNFIQNRVICGNSQIRM